MYYVVVDTSKPMLYVNFWIFITIFFVLLSNLFVVVVN